MAYSTTSSMFSRRGNALAVLLLQVLTAGLFLNNGSIATASSLTSVGLPHLDIFVLCNENSNNNIDDLLLPTTTTHVNLLSSFYSDLLPSAFDIQTTTLNSEKCEADGNRTQIQMNLDAVALLTDDSPLLDEQDEIKALVTQDLLASYFKDVCEDELIHFEAVVSDAGSYPLIEIETQGFGTLGCRVDPYDFVYNNNNNDDDPFGNFNNNDDPFGNFDDDFFDDQVINDTVRAGAAIAIGVWITVWILTCCCICGGIALCIAAANN